jgi:hypothetical protein
MEFYWLRRWMKIWSHLQPWERLQGARPQSHKNRQELTQNSLHRNPLKKICVYRIPCPQICDLCSDDVLLIKQISLIIVCIKFLLSEWVVFWQVSYWTKKVMAFFDGLIYPRLLRFLSLCVCIQPLEILLKFIAWCKRRLVIWVKWGLINMIKYYHRIFWGKYFYSEKYRIQLFSVLRHKYGLNHYFRQIQDLAFKIEKVFFLSWVATWFPKDTGPSHHVFIVLLWPCIFIRWNSLLLHFWHLPFAFGLMRPLE